MHALFQPWQLLFAILCGWVNERQQRSIEFQNTQIETLLQKLGKKRILLTDDQRRVLAVKAKAVGRKALMQLTTIVAPDTILRWPKFPSCVRKWRFLKLFWARNRRKLFCDGGAMASFGVQKVQRRCSDDLWGGRPRFWR